MSGIRKSKSAKQSILVLAISLFSTTSAMAHGPVTGKHRSFLPAQVHVVSTVPSNGDLNPYGVEFVPSKFPAGAAKSKDILVSNFNNNQNLQGTGSTIVDIAPNGSAHVFFQGNGLMGLTTALNALKKGFVLVGNFPSADGTCGNADNGSIIVIDKDGNQLQNIVDKDFINGPWDSTLFDQGDKAKFFIANALTGTVVRFDLEISPTGVDVKNKTQIASGYQHQCDSVTFVDAPTGLVYNHDKDILYVSSTMDNAVYSVPNAGKTKQDLGQGTLVFSSKKHLHGALAMMSTPKGNLVVSNNDAINPDPAHPSALVEFTIHGEFVKEITVDSNPGGAFGLNTATVDDTTRFAAVDDNENILLIWTFPK